LGRNQNKKHRRITGEDLYELFRHLLEKLGAQCWWPGTTAFEIMAGAILTQNTNWSNVALSIARLKKAGLMTPDRMYTKRRSLAGLIRSSGYFRVKSKRLMSFVRYYLDKYQGSVRKMSKIPTDQLRIELRQVNGIGDETADSILLYALDRPVFVVDAYTRRILSRHRLIKYSDDYRNIQSIFTDNVPVSAEEYNEYHALLVYVGKKYCHKNDPDCSLCPVNSF
jgi:endonuclease-3 related protein